MDSCAWFQGVSSPQWDDSGCDSVTKLNVTSCDGKMSYTVSDLSASTNYTVLLAVWNSGGPSQSRIVTVVTQAPRELIFLCYY